MNLWHRSSFLILMFFCSPVSSFAFPEYLEMFRMDSYRRAGVDGCNVCHNSPRGGDERNPFGREFEAGGAQITPLLRAQFPDRFAYPVSRVGDTLVVHFSDPASKQVVVENGGTKALVDVEKKSVDGKEATVPGAAASPAAAVAPPATPTAPAREESEVPVDEYAREGAFFGSRVVNLPNGKPQRAGGTDFLIGHRFTQRIFPIFSNDKRRGSAADLFGFDSSARVTFGVNVGVTGRISVAAARSNIFRTVELSSTVQVSRQKDAVPLTFQVRGGIEGRNNFRDRYSPFIQLVSVRTFLDRLSFVFAPTFAFNTRNENTFLPPEFLFGEEHNHTISLGAGMGIRFLPSTSVVAEYIPRAYGFRGELRDRPGVSMGIQKSTFRHTFEFVLSTQEPMTTSQYAVNGTDTFRVGFNIYRKLR